MTEKAGGLNGHSHEWLIAKMENGLKGWELYSVVNFNIHTQINAFEYGLKDLCSKMAFPKHNQIVCNND